MILFLCRFSIFHLLNRQFLEFVSLKGFLRNFLLFSLDKWLVLLFDKLNFLLLSLMKIVKSPFSLVEVIVVTFVYYTHESLELFVGLICRRLHFLMTRPCVRSS
jgi:hypothetical protein